MNQIIQNFLTRAKSKLPPGIDNPNKLPQYTSSDFYDKAIDLMVLYDYADSEEDRTILRELYKKMVAYFNPLKRGIINPGGLEVIDKIFKQWYDEHHKSLTEEDRKKALERIQS